MTGRAGARRTADDALALDVFERIRRSMRTAGGPELPFPAEERAQPAAPPDPDAPVAPAERVRAVERALPSLYIDEERIVHVTPEGQRQALALEKVFERVGPSPPLPDMVWPLGIRAVRTGQGGFTLAYEAPPGVRRLRWGVRTENERRFSYREVQLALPYVVIVTGVRIDARGTMTFDGWTEAYFANESLRSLTAPLCPAPLLNVVGRSEPHHSGGAVVCMSGFGHTSTPADGEPSERLHRGLAAVLGHFFESGFNEDFERTGRISAFHDPHSKPADLRLATVEAWEEASAKDPSFVLQIPWIPIARTLSRSMEAVAEQLGIVPRTPSWNRTLQRLIARHGARIDAPAPSAGSPDASPPTPIRP